MALLGGDRPRPDEIEQIVDETHGDLPEGVTRIQREIVR
jgi:hypothetical protein